MTRSSDTTTTTTPPPCPALPWLTKENVANLRRLADYLDSLPEGYEHFSMEVYYVDPKSARYSSKTTPERAARLGMGCGTSACALGHGPAAGIVPVPNTGWGEYAFLFVGNHGFVDPQYYLPMSGLWSFLFSPNWYRPTVNTPHQAAARIRYALEHGVPDRSPTRSIDIDYTRTY